MHPLEHVLLRFNAADSWTALQAAEGTFITGSPGSGKSSTSAFRIAESFLNAGYGGLVLVGKPEETENWKRYAEKTGRSNDLIIFNVESNHCFDPLYYEWNRPGRGAADFEGIIDMFNTLLSIGKPQTGTLGSERFWELAAEQLMRNVLVMLAHSNQPMSIEIIDRMISELPKKPAEAQTQHWKETSFAGQVITHVMDKSYPTLTEEQKSDVNIAHFFLTERWPAFDERPRSSVEMTWSGMADKFLFSPANRLFCSGTCTFLPEHTTHARKIVICDFPVLVYGLHTGRLINCLLKIAFMRAWLRRDVKQYPTPAFLWQDEGQLFLLPGSGGASRDNAFAQVARSSRICTVFVTQNILNVSEALAENSPGSRTKSLLGNFALKIFHQQNDVDTNEYAASLIGKQSTYMKNIAADPMAPNISQSEQLMFKLEPDAFTMLEKPDITNPCASAIVYQGGAPFKSTISNDHPVGQNFLEVRFRRD